MNWVKELCDLYDKNEHIAGEYREGRFGEPLILLPPFHTTVKAQITVTINEEGAFLRAERVAEDDSLTIIPVTEKSASRTRGIDPNPLCDVLKYVAGDYMTYITPKKDNDFSKNYDAYIKQLEAWAASPKSHSKVNAIYKYLKKKSLMKDLLSVGIFELDEDGAILPNCKIAKINQIDSFVRFEVSSDHMQTKCWKDLSLQQAFVEYYREQESENYGMSYLTGKNGQISYLHPRKIRNEGDSAKLMSANDETNYTYLGRFKSKEEAFAIGYEESQKLHNALKWIIRKQGRNWSGMSIVTWESQSGDLPDWSQNSDEICDGYEDDEGWDDDDDDQEQQVDKTNPVDATRFLAAINGYRSKLEVNSKMLLMAFDAATTGRLAIMQSQELQSSVFLKNLQTWHEDCGWIQIRYKNKGVYTYYGMVGIKEIANILYGTESNKELSLKGSNQKKDADVCKRLLPCIILGRPIPIDMVRLAVQRASSPVSYESQINWSRTLALACSLVKKKLKEQNEKGDWTVALDEKNCSRSYLYGRLLAVADRVEYRTMTKEESRETNAKRYMNAFSQQPFRTWKVIEERMQPYLNKLKDAERLKYEHLIEEICWLFKEGEFEKKDSLDGTYLLGFHNQSYALRNKTEEEASND